MGDEKVEPIIPDTLMLYATYLPSVNDLTLILLKGHLLIEKCLISIIERKCLHPKALEKAQLRFPQKLCLVEALGYLDKNSHWIFKLIEQINKIRNDLAHKLEIPELNKNIEKLLNSIDKNVPTLSLNNRESAEERLRGAFAFLCGVLSNGKNG